MFFSMEIRKHGRSNAMSCKGYLVTAILVLVLCLVLFPLSFVMDSVTSPIVGYFTILLAGGAALFLIWFFVGLGNEEFHPILFPLLVMCMAGALFGWLNSWSVFASLPVMGFGYWLGLVILKQDQVLPEAKKYAKRLNYPPTKKEGALIFWGEFAVMALIIVFLRHYPPLYQALLQLRK